MDLRCKGVKHAELFEPGIIEVKCRSRICGAQKGVVVIHRFDTFTGELLETKQFKEPIKNGLENGSCESGSPVRDAGYQNHSLY